MSYFYSQELTYCQGIMPRQIGWEVVNQLGELEQVHFQNKQIDYENPYCKSLKRCDEAIAKLNDVKKIIAQINPKFAQKPVQNYKDMLKHFNKEIRNQNIHGHLYINEIEDEIKEIHQYLTRHHSEQTNLQHTYNQKILELSLYVTLSSSDEFAIISKQKKSAHNSSMFDYKCILLDRKDQTLFQKGLFRISRGHCWTKILEINIQKLKSYTHSQQHEFLNEKIACIIVFQLGQSNTLLNKINRYISCMDSKSLNLDIPKWTAAIAQLQKQTKQIQSLINLTSEAIERYLHKLYENYSNSQFSYLTYLESYANKEREIYRKLASMNESKNFLRFHVFIPTKQLPLKLNLNEKMPPLTLTPKIPHHDPPSKFDTNQMLKIPQEIVNTYGVPSYCQFNPAPLYIVTFGFFIGVMFGDIGHMLMIIPFFIYFKVNTWAWTVAFFMGYCGLIYNQFFGLNLGLFSTCYTLNSQKSGFVQSSDCVYPVGIDSIWKISQNSMQYTNSFKMKLAVILGVTHMLLGICIKIINSIKQKKWSVLILLALPQLVFMFCTFFYMDFLIILKWTQNYSGSASKNAPSIISTMISAFAGFGDGSLLFWSDERNFQIFLKITTFIMASVMLIGIPLLHILKNKNKRVEAVQAFSHGQFNELIDEKLQNQDNKTGSEDGMSERRPNSSEMLDSKLSSNLHQNHEEFSEIVVHSFIETIQFVLGTVSNTASYLRLWALSLAHSQLSQVIYELILRKAIKGGYAMIPAAFFAFIFFYSITFGVLICMDSMECFLHSLRLHWVQFQNKFYSGKGYQFQAFSFKQICQKS